MRRNLARALAVFDRLASGCSWAVVMTSNEGAVMKNSSGLNVAKRVVSVALASGAMVLASAGVASAQGASEAVVGNSVGVVAGYDFDRELPLAGVDGRFTFALGSPLAL